MEIKARLRIGLTLYLAAGAGIAARGGAGARLFIANNSGQWCAYVTQDALNSAPKSRDPEYIVVAEAREGQLATILIRRSTEDTTTYDEYSIGHGASLLRLVRTFDAIPERVTRKQIWSLQGGVARKVSEIWTEVGTEMPVPNERVAVIKKDYLEHGIMTRISDFPFARLLAEPSHWPSKHGCVPGDSSTLEAAVTRRD